VSSFKLNGREVSVAGDTATPLIYLLRNQCGATGVRFGCGTGHCGACTVIIDGQAEQSCSVGVWAAADKTVQTPDGLADHPVGSVIRQAFIDLQAAQCGYCINGIVMELTALLSRTPQPDDETLTRCLNRHLCRCGTHLRIWRAARLAITRLTDSRVAVSLVKNSCLQDSQPAGHD
jgi:nicotinate dehydrogenase subunit A